MRVLLAATVSKNGPVKLSHVDIDDFSEAEVARLMKGQVVVRHIKAGFYIELQKFSVDMSA